MRPSDPLEVQEGAPPLRYGVEDVISAGRRHRRRRIAGWVAGTALAVAAVIAVPVVVTRNSAERPDTVPLTPGTLGACVNPGSSASPEPPAPRTRSRC